MFSIIHTTHLFCNLLGEYAYDTGIALFACNGMLLLCDTARTQSGIVKKRPSWWELTRKKGLFYIPDMANTLPSDDVCNCHLIIV